MLRGTFPPKGAQTIIGDIAVACPGAVCPGSSHSGRLMRHVCGFADWAGLLWRGSLLWGHGRPFASRPGLPRSQVAGAGGVHHWALALQFLWGGQVRGRLKEPAGGPRLSPRPRQWSRVRGWEERPPEPVVWGSSCWRRQRGPRDTGKSSLSPAEPQGRSPLS